MPLIETPVSAAVSGTIRGAFGLAGSIVEAAGNVARGAGEAIGGALQGALTPPNEVVVNNIGIAGEAGKKKVSGKGTLPVPKKAAKPTVNANMPTEKLLVVAVNYLSSIEKTLQAQLKFEGLAYQQQAQAEREAAVEREAKGPGIFSQLGDKFGALKDTLGEAPSRASKLGKLALGAGIVGALGLAGISQLDTSQLEELRANFDAFQEKFSWVFDIVSGIAGALGVGGFTGATVGWTIAGWRGAIIGAAWGWLYEKTGSGTVATAGAAGAGALTTQMGRRIAWQGLKWFGTQLLTRGLPFVMSAAGVVGGLATAATVAMIYGVDQTFKATQRSVQGPTAEFYASHGLYPQYSENGLTVTSWHINMPERNLNNVTLTRGQLAGNDRPSDDYYYWRQVSQCPPTDRSRSAQDARQWLASSGQTWLDEHWPITEDATPVPANDNQPAQDAQQTSGTSISGAPVVSPQDTDELPPAASGPIDAILDKTPQQLTDAELRQLVERQGRIENPSGSLNNPGGLPVSSARTTPYANNVIGDVGANGAPQVRIAKFDTAENGIRAAMWLWRNGSRYRDKSVRDGLGAWSTGYDGRNPNYERMLGSARPGWTGNPNIQPGFGSASGLIGSAMSIGAGAIKAVGNIMAAGFGEGRGTRPLSESLSQTTPKNNAANMSALSASIQQDIDFGASGDTQPLPGVDAILDASNRSLKQSNPSGALGVIDPNYPGTGGVNGYLQYYRLAA